MSIGFVQLVEQGDLDAFELRCMELIEKGDLRPTELGPAFRKLERAKDREKVSALGRMVLDSEAGGQSDALALLPVARATLIAAPDDEALRQRVIDLYKAAYGDRDGFDLLLDQSGIESGRPPRTALRLIDVCMELKPGDVLMSRSDEQVIEIIDVELTSGLITVRRDGRPRSLAAADLTKDFEPVDPDDFRVLRTLRGEKLRDLLDNDPVSVVIGLLRMHEGRLDQDLLKRELVPLHLASSEWAKWWTRARKALQTCANVIVEGRSPVMLTYTAAPRTIEDETWEAIEKQRDPADWLTSMDSYLKTRAAEGAAPQPDLLLKIRNMLSGQFDLLSTRRPTEALECALLIERLDEVLATDSEPLARPFLRDHPDPAALLRGIRVEAFWGLALDALLAARPDEAANILTGLFPQAPATMLDRFVKAAQGTPALTEIQAHVDLAVADPVRFPEILYWLWKGPAKDHGLTLPDEDALFREIIETLSALDRTLHPGIDVMKTFRNRMRQALALRSGARAAGCLERISGHRAVTLRRQLERLEGMGDTVPQRLIAKLREQHPELWYKAPVRIEPWADPDMIFSTQHGIQTKTEERDELVNVKMRENAQRIGEAAALGDLSENSEYKYALEERDLLRARLAQVNHDLSVAQRIEPDDVPTDHVGVGSSVVLRRVSDGAEIRMTFLGPFDADVDRGIYNYKAPMSQRLMGLRVGDRATLALDGNDMEFEVVQLGNGVPRIGMA